MMKPAGERYFEDYAPGDVHEFGSIALSEADILEFGRRYDPQYLHVDAERAARGPYGGLIASGWHTAAITMRLLVEGGVPLAGGLIGLGGSLRWPRPARPGDVLTVHGEITEVTPSKPDRGTIAIKAETRNQRGEVVQSFTATLLVPRRATQTNNKQ